MKFRILIAISLLAPLLIAVACSSANKPPTAFIDSITPSQAKSGDTVILTGHGNDSDGKIASYEWRSSLDGALGNDSTLKISSLSSGHHTISLKVCDNNGACSNETISTLTVTAKPLDDKAAAERVIDKIIEPMNYGGPIIGYKLDRTLKPGDTVAPYRGQKQVIENESYFYMIDLYPNTYYTHDVLFVRVDKTNGGINVTRESWWPLINGKSPEWVSNESAFWNKDNWFYSADISRPYAKNISAPQARIPQQQQWREASLIVNGHADGDSLGWDSAMSCWVMWVLFDYYITPGNTYSLPATAGGANTPADMLDLLDGLCDEGYDHITVYIINHGGLDVILMGGQCLYPRDLIDFCEDHGNTSFSFLIETCEAGSFIDDLREVENIEMVLTATSTLYGALPDNDAVWDPNPEDGGSEWTSSLYFGALEQIEHVGWAAINAEAARITVPPSIVLLLAAFNNDDYSDSRDLDSAYIGGCEFPQAWAQVGNLCRLWDEPPANGEALLHPDAANSGSVDTDGRVVTGLTEHSGNLWFGYDDTKRYFFSYQLPAGIPAGSEVLSAAMFVKIDPEWSCDLGHVGDFFIEHLSYGTLDASDFAAPANVASNASIECWGRYSRLEYTAMLQYALQWDIDNHRAQAQFRFRLISDSEVRTYAPDMLIYYEVR